MSQTLEHQDARPWNYDGREIIADGVVHGLGLLLAIAGTVALLAFFDRDSIGLTAHLVYCASLLITLSASAAYNLWPVSPTKWRLRRVDHAMIFGLIAGTYTPFLVRIGTLETALLLGAIWTVSLVGIGLKLANVGEREWLSTILYIALGWSGLIAIPTLVGNLPLISIELIISGGLLYSVGVAFHHWRALRFQNAIWHGFVLVAASCHFAAIMVATDGR